MINEMFRKAESTFLEMGSRSWASYPDTFS